MKFPIKVILLFYSFFQSKMGFGCFGRGSVIKYPYRLWGKKNIKIGKKVFIAQNSFLSAVRNWGEKSYNPKLIIGDNTTIGSSFFATCINEIIIEKNVLISDMVFISDHIHDYFSVREPILRQKLKFKGKVLIKEGSFIGINAVIMPGVIIGRNSVVGASSVVTKNVPDYYVVTGNPAKPIKKYNKNTKKWERIK